MSYRRKIQGPIRRRSISTTRRRRRVDPRVLEAMLPCFTEHFGNPHSTSHAYGHVAAAAVEEARGEIAALIDADPREIVFTSGATEANNLAIKGAAHFPAPILRLAAAGPHRHLDDRAQMRARKLRAWSARASRSPICRSSPTGLVALDELEAALDERTLFVSVMAAHNEIGVMQPLAEIGALCRARGVLFHTDAAQAVGKIPLDVEAMHIDLMSISGHKLYGPKGIGALYVRRRPRVRLLPLIDGGGQERGLRSGTLPTPLCVGLGRAAAIAAQEMADEAAASCAIARSAASGLAAPGPRTSRSTAMPSGVFPAISI